MKNNDSGSAAVVVLGVVVALFLIVAITVGGYLGGWWLKNDQAKREGNLRQQSSGNQIALVDQINQDAKDALQLGIPATQRKAIISDMCNAQSRLNGTIPLQSFTVNLIAEECK